MQTAAVEINDGIYKDQRKLNVWQWLDIWQKDCLGGVKASTSFLYGKQIKLYIKPAQCYYLAPPKNDKSRTISPTPWVMHILRQHRAAQAEQRLKLGARGKDIGLKSPNETDGFLSYRTVDDCF